MLTLLQLGTMAVEALVANVTSEAYSGARKRLVSLLKNTIPNTEAVDDVRNNTEVLKDEIIEKAAQDSAFKQELQQLIEEIESARSEVVNRSRDIITSGGQQIGSTDRSISVAGSTGDISKVDLSSKS